MLTSDELDQVVAHLASLSVRIPQLEEGADHGDPALDDLIALYMVAADKTVYVPLSAIAALLAASAATPLDTPTLSLDVTSDTEIEASWDAVANATAYKLYRSDTANFNDAVLVYSGSGLLYNDSGLTAGTQYWYWVQATAGGYADSGYSSATTTTTGASADVTPPTVASIEVNVSNPYEVVVTYNEDLFNVASGDTSKFKIIPTSGSSLNAKTISFMQATGLTVKLTVLEPFAPGENFFLNYTGNEVKDLASNLAAVFSNQPIENNLVANAVQLPKPSLLSAYPVADDEILLNWTDVSNESGYETEYSEDGSTWLPGPSTAAGVLTDSITGLTASTPYYVRVKALGDGVNYLDSDWQNSSAITRPSSGAAFDTSLTFAIAVTDAEAGVSGTVSAVNATKKFEFNAITPRTGMSMHMILKVGLFTGVIINYSSDYMGKPFRYTHSDGTVYLNNFLNVSGTLTL